MSPLEQKLSNVINSVHAAFIDVEIGFHNALEISLWKYLKVPDEDGV